MSTSPLYPHQVAALKKLSNGKILWGGVGTGKSRVAAEYYLLHEAPRAVYVITTAKKRDDFDWQQQFYELGVGPLTGPTGIPKKVLQRTHHPSKPGLGDGHEALPREALEGDGGVDENSAVLLGRMGTATTRSDLQQDGSRMGSTNIERSYGDGTYPWVLTVDSWNNIAKYADVAGAFFIFDEQRLVGSGDWTRKFLRIAKHNHWILLSGTPGDTWMDYVPVFVANNFYKNRTEFKREHVVYNTFTKFPKVDRYINVGRLVRQRAELLVEMPYVRHTKRRSIEVELPYDKDTLDLVLKKRWHVYEDRPLRDVAEMFAVARKVVNSDPSRLEKVKELWTKHPKLIVFYNFNYELASLRSLTECCGINSTTGLSSGLDLPSQSLSNHNSKSSQTSKSRLQTIPSGRAINSSPTQSLNAQVQITEWNRSESWKDGLPNPSVKSGSFQNGSSLLFHTAQSKPGSDGNDRSGKKSSGTKSTAATVGIAEWNGHKHQPVPETDRWLYLVQYVAGAEAWECTETDATVFYSRTYSWKVWQQAHGRMDRLNTPFVDLWYYNFTSTSWIDRAIERSLKAKENFNEARYAGLFKG